MSEYCRLFYCSLTHPLIDGASRRRWNREIFGSARRNNARRDVTGGLLCGAGHFAQLLEGPFDGVMTTISAIRNDPRHWDLVVLRLDSVEERSLPSWSMAEVDLPTRQNSLTEQLMRRAHGRDVRAVTSLLRLIRQLGATDTASMDHAAPQPGSSPPPMQAGARAGLTGAFASTYTPQAR